MKLTGESFYRVTMLSAYTTYFWIRSCFASKPPALSREEELERLNQWIENEGEISVVLRSFLAPALFLGPTLYVFYPRWVSYFKIPLSSPLRLAATGVTLASLPLLFWIHCHLGTFWSSDLEVQEEHQLVTSGLYQWIRHPMYTALLLFYAGTSLTAANWLVLIPNFASIIIMLARIEKEEEMLLKKFGQEYLDYKERTGTLLPRPVNSLF